MRMRNIASGAGMGFVVVGVDAMAHAPTGSFNNILGVVSLVFGLNIWHQFTD